MERTIEIVVNKRLDFKLNGDLKQKGYHSPQMSNAHLALLHRPGKPLK